MFFAVVMVQYFVSQSIQIQFGLLRVLQVPSEETKILFRRVKAVKRAAVFAGFEFGLLKQVVIKVAC